MPRRNSKPDTPEFAALVEASKKSMASFLAKVVSPTATGSGQSSAGAVASSSAREEPPSPPSPGLDSELSALLEGACFDVGDEFPAAQPDPMPSGALIFATALQSAGSGLSHAGPETKTGVGYAKRAATTPGDSDPVAKKIRGGHSSELPPQVVPLSSSSSVPQPAVSRPPSEGPSTVVGLGAMLASQRPVCFKCNYECDPFRAQLKGKSPPKYVCNGCNTRQTMLSKTLSGWPSEFRELSEEEQIAFWRSAATARTSDQLQAKLVDCLVQKRVDRQLAKVAGSYLPLSVYRAQGFDADRIERLCTDTTTHPVLGLCYRVQIASLERSSMEESAREQVMRTLGKRLSAPPSGRALSWENDEVAEPVIDGKDSEDSNSNTSSSSSSSSDKKKSRKKKSRKSKGKKSSKKEKGGKGKKGGSKKEMKAKKAQETDLKERKAASKKIQTSAQKIVTKVSVPLFALEQDMANPLFKKIAGFASESVKKSHTLLSKMKTEAQDKMAAPVLENITPLSWTFDEVSEAVKTANTNSAVARSMLAAAQGHFGAK